MEKGKTMSDLISRQALREAMYHEAFETDTDMQRWDSGCWIRYKMFENALSSAPSIDAVTVVRCKDCTEFSDDDEEDGWGFCNNTGVGMERDGFCSCGERKDDE